MLAQGKIHGYVRDAVLGTPIPLATVVLVATGQSTNADANGYYEITEPQFSGQSRITASANGYEPETETVWYDAENPTQERVDFSLVRANVPPSIDVAGICADKPHLDGDRYVCSSPTGTAVMGTTYYIPFHYRNVYHSDGSGNYIANYRVKLSYYDGKGNWVFASDWNDISDTLPYRPVEISWYFWFAYNTGNAPGSGAYIEVAIKDTITGLYKMAESSKFTLV